MRTPQVEPDWNYGIWTGRSVIVKPIDEQLNDPANITEPTAWTDTPDDEQILFDQVVQ